MPPPAKPSRDSSSPNRDRFAWLLIQLVGQSVTATLKGGVRVQGILAAATPSDGDLSIALRQVIDLAQDPKPAVPKPSLLVNGRDLLEIDASDIAIDSPAPQNGSAASEGGKKTAGGAQSKEGDSFRTDVDISADRLRASAGQGRQLQAWGGLEDDSLEGGIGGGGGGGGGLENGGRGWDQFAANERQFGLKTDYDEEIYTTKLDKSGKDYKSREARAAQLEREILKGGSGITNNAHMAEERGEQLPDTQNEEDRYGAVQRSEGAYVPPGARKAALARLSTQQGSNGAPSTSSSGIVKSTPVHTGSSRLPSVASGTSRIPPTSGAPFITTSPAPSTAGGAAPSPASATVTTPGGGFTVGEKFRDFVTDEKKRLEAKKAQIQQQAMKKEHDSKLASLLQWSQSFKNPYAVPDDIAIITGKKPGGLTADAKASTSAATSPSNSLRPLPPTSPSPTPSAPSAAAAPAATKPSAPKKPTRPLIPEIPPFNPNKGKTAAATSTAPPQSNSSPAPPSVTAPSPSVSPSISAKAPTTKLKATAGAFVFKPNAAAASFTPGASKASSPAVLAAAAPSASIPSLPSSLTAVPPSGETTLNPNANPFFGPKPLKRGPSSTSLHVKEDFTPFTANKTLPSPEQVAPAWPFSGKPYRTIYGPQGQPLSLAEQQQQQHQHQLQQQQQSMQGLAAMQAHAAAIAAMQQGGPPPLPLQQQLPQQPIATVIPNLTGGVPPPPPPPQSVPPQMPVQILSPPPPHPQQGQQQPGGGGSGFTPRFAAPPPPGQQQQQPQQQQQQIPGLPPGMQFIPGVGLVPIGVNVGGPGGGGAGGPPVQFAQQHPGFPGQFGGGGGGPQQGGQGGQQRFGGGFQPGQGQPPMFTSPSMLHPSHPRHQQQQQQQQFHPQHQQQQQRGSFGPGAPPPWAQQQQQQQGPNGPGGGGGGGGGTPTMQPAQGMPPQLLLQQQQAPQL